MDYLDPKKKKNKKMRLMIGYGLLGIAIALATIILVNIARGIAVDPSTGTVIQNGLIFVDTKPESARVFLNGVQQSGQTDARLVVPEGVYDIELQRDGYHNWTRTLRLEGGKLRRITYPRLIPSQLETDSELNLPSVPSVVSQSNDKRWLVLAYNNDPLRMQYIDINAGNPSLQPLQLPVELITPVEGGAWDIIEWADDQKTFLASYTSTEGVEYVLIDRENSTTQSVNVSTQLPDEVFTRVEMRDRKRDLVFLHNDATGTLKVANTTSGTVEPFLEGVVDFTTFGRDSVLYVADPTANDGLVRVVLQRGGDEYIIKDEFLESSTAYLLEMAQLGNALVIGIGSPAENRVIVYNDPIFALEQNDFSDIPIPTTVLRVENPQELSISADSSVILARNGVDFVAHEFEEDRSYVFTVDGATDTTQELEWADGQHFIVADAQKQQIISDFDGSNQHALTASELTIGSHFDAALDDLYTVVPMEDDVPPRLMRTYMRTQADR